MPEHQRSSNTNCLDLHLSGFNFETKCNDIQDSFIRDAIKLCGGFWRKNNMMYFVYSTRVFYTDSTNVNVILPCAVFRVLSNKYILPMSKEDIDSILRPKYNVVRLYLDEEKNKIRSYEHSKFQVINPELHNVAHDYYIVEKIGKFSYKIVAAINY